MSDPTLSDIVFKNKMAMVWSPDSGLPLNEMELYFLLKKVGVDFSFLKFNFKS